MKDVLRKAILVGLGAGALTKEKLEKLLKELKKSKLTPKEGKKFVSKLLKESEKDRRAFLKVAEKQLKRVAKKSGVTVKNIQRAQAALAELEKMVSKKRKAKKRRHTRKRR